MSTASTSSVRAMLIVMGCSALAACSSGISGEYEPQDMAGKVALKSIKFEGKEAFITTSLGTITRVPFEVDGERVILTNAGQSQVFQLTEEGCLDAGMLGKLCKKKT